MAPFQSRFIKKTLIIERCYSRYSPFTLLNGGLDRFPSKEWAVVRLSPRVRARVRGYMCRSDCGCGVHGSACVFRRDNHGILDISPSASNLCVGKGCHPLHHHLPPPATTQIQPRGHVHVCVWGNGKCGESDDWWWCLERSRWRGKGSSSGDGAWLEHRCR